MISKCPQRVDHLKFFINMFGLIAAWFYRATYWSWCTARTRRSENICEVLGPQVSARQKMCLNCIWNMLLNSIRTWVCLLQFVFIGWNLKSNRCFAQWQFMMRKKKRRYDLTHFGCCNWDWRMHYYMIFCSGFWKFLLRYESWANEADAEWSHSPSRYVYFKSLLYFWDNESVIWSVPRCKGNHS